MISISSMISTSYDLNLAIIQTSNQFASSAWDPLAITDEAAKELRYRDPAQTPLRTASHGESTVQGTPGPGSLSPDLVPPPVPAAAPTKRPWFVALQEWEGVVTLVQEDAFIARLVDVTCDDASPDEEAEFSLSELSDDDVALVVPGAIFRWSIGIERMPGGAKRATSQIVFRRLPQWTKRDLQRADAVAKQLIDAFGNTAPSASNENRSAG